MSRPGAHHERLFRLLLRLYPAAFRRAHGDEMVELFCVRLARCAGPRERLALWLRVLGDTGRNALALRGARGPDEKTRGRGEMGTLAEDVRYALRQLRRTPLFTASAVGLLAVGIGVTTAVFTLVDAVLLRPPPFERPEEVVAVYQDSDDGEPGGNAFPAYRDIAEASVFSQVAATTPADAMLDTDDGPLPVSVEFTTASYLDVLGLTPARGRWFSPEHDQVGSARAAVVSYPAWRARFGADPSLIGRTVRLNGQPVTVIGVGSRELSGSFAPVVTDFWLSISSVALGGSFRVENLDRRQDHWYDIRARLAPGVGLEQARAAMDALAARMAEQYPEIDRGRGIDVYRAADVRIHPTADGQIARAAGLLMTVVGLVLVLACANLANLLLVRGIGRSGEVAVRRAMGASRARIARLFLTESLLLSVLGGVAGFAVARWLVSLLPSMPLPYPLSATLDVGLDARVLLFGTGLVLVTGALFGLAPALRSAGADVSGMLREDGRTTSAGRGTARTRNTLVALQVAASLVLVLFAGLIGRSLTALQHVDTGVDAERVAFVRTSLAQAGLSGAEAGVALDELLSRIESLPGVESAAATTRLPATEAGSTTTVVEGYDPPSGTDAVELDFAVVSPDYFATVGLALLEGRDFGDEDTPETQTVVVVNETAARLFWGGVDPLGRRMRPQDAPDRWRVVIGVVEDTPVSAVGRPPEPMFYFTTQQSPPASPYLVARTGADPAALLPAVREQVCAVRSSLTVMRQGTLSEHFGAGLAGQRFAAAAMGVFSLLALLLASLGIYAVVAFSVARRSAELGIRIALGAGRWGVVRMVVGEIAGTVALGLLAGVGLCVVAAPRLADALFGVRPLDPPTLGASVVVLLLVSAGAAWFPARRAAGVDPVAALRN